MFLINIHYTASIEEIDKHLQAHRDFLETGYQNNFFICSGPKNPRTGGVILSQLQDRERLQSILKNDPFLINQLATYEIIEFTPVKYHADFKTFIKSEE